MATTPTRQVTHVRVDGHGRMVIPAEMRGALAIGPGTRLTVILEDGEIRVRTMRETLRRVQEEVAKYIPADRSLVDELIAERRAEAAREEQEIRESQARRKRGR